MGSLPAAAEKTSTGWAATSNWEMTGGFAPVGSCPTAMPTLSRTLWTPSFSATESLKRTNTRETSSRDQEKTRSTPEMPATASSIGRVTDSSMSWGDAPG